MVSGHQDSGPSDQEGRAEAAANKRQPLDDVLQRPLVKEQVRTLPKGAPAAHRKQMLVEQRRRHWSACAARDEAATRTEWMGPVSFERDEADCSTSPCRRAARAAGRSSTKCTAFARNAGPRSSSSATAAAQPAGCRSKRRMQNFAASASPSLRGSSGRGRRWLMATSREASRCGSNMGARSRSRGRWRATWRRSFGTDGDAILVPGPAAPHAPVATRVQPVALRRARACEGDRLSIGARISSGA